MLNIFLYLLGLLPLTHLIVALRPTMNTNGTGEHTITIVNVSFIEVIITVMISIISSYSPVLAYMEIFINAYTA